MAIDSESLYVQLGQLIAEMPDLDEDGNSDAVPSETYVWLGRAATLVKLIGPLVDSAAFATACDNLASGRRYYEANRIKSIVHRSLATAELNAPASAKGLYVAVGAAFDVLKAVSKIMNEAKSDVLVIDPYMNAKVLTDFAPLAPDGVKVRLLSDSQSTQHGMMQPAVSKWVSQYGATRLLEARLSDPRALHDRLILVDGKQAWLLTQSLKDFAVRSPGTVVRLDAELATLKVHWYEQLWLTAAPIC